MARRRQKLRLPEPPGAEPAMPLGRILAGLVVLVGLGVVLLQVGSRVLDADAAPPAEAPVAAAEQTSAAARPELLVRALENVRVTVEIDGEVVHQGTLPGGTARRFTAGTLTAVELEDLTRATVHFDGRRVEPLGSLNAPRRLEFVDDL